MSDEPQLDPPTKTETTVRHYDTHGQLISETITVVTQRTKPKPPTGFTNPPQPSEPETS